MPRDLTYPCPSHTYIPQPAFGVMGKKSFYLGATGAAARMKLVVNMIMGAMMGAFCEVRGLACGCVLGACGRKGGAWSWWST